MHSGRRPYNSSKPLPKEKQPAKDRGKAKLSAHNVVGGAISVRGQFNVIMNEVRGRLSRRNLEEFRRTCFGHLLDVPVIQYQGQLIFLLLNALEAESKNRNSMCFALNGTRMELGSQEFFCITGLKFKEADEPPLASRMHTDIFSGKANLKAHDIDEAFDNYSSLHKGHGSLVLKLALLHVVYGLLINRDQLSKNIAVKYMHLVDDLDLFNNYPWGRVAYDFLVHWIHIARDNINQLKQTCARPAIDICGFSISLQIFTFETLFVLTDDEKCRLQEDGLPIRVGVPPKKLVQLQLIDEDDIVIEDRSIGNEKRRSPRKHAGSKGDMVTSNEAQKSNKRSKSENATPMSFQLVAKMIVIGSLEESIKSLEESIQNLALKVDVANKVPNVNENATHHATTDNDSSSHNRTPKFDVVDSTHNVNDNTEGKCLDNVRMKGKIVQIEGRGKKLDDDTCAISTPLSPVADHTIVPYYSRVPYVNMIQTISCDFVISDIMEEMASFDDISSMKKPAKKRLFNDGLWEDTSGLLDLQIFGEPSKKKASEYAKKLKQQKPIQLGSLMVHTYLPIREYNWSVEKSFHQWYSQGLHTNLKPSCWIIWSQLQIEFFLMWRNVPILCDHGDVYRSKPLTKTRRNVWELVRYEHPPQQSNCDDCGIMATKYLECLATGTPFDSIDPMRCIHYHRAYCVELFEKSHRI
ncbi:hypothetical protein C2S51_034279 [Perilla frutescens var. frutescens]|nr:hypothetical protein C2S51_034279 [Perilla frutescens var. frutescens]